VAEIFVGRQPILDRRLEIAGYELLFRGGNVEHALVTNHDGATATVVLNTFTEIGLERVVGSHRAWLNVNRDFLVNKLAFTIPPHLVGLEILEDQVIDGHLVGAVRELKNHGYRLALDDFTYTRHSEQLLKLVDYVKVDIRALARPAFIREVNLAKQYGASVIAEKVETREEHAFCAQLGCDRFQGYFFCKPEVISQRAVRVNRVSLLELLAALQDPAIELHTLEHLMGHDVALSYRLLRYINSAFFGLRRRVSSLGQALALLGLQNVKRWATLSVFAGVDDKPAELTITALARARYCERSADRFEAASADQLFTVGLFSVVDALMDAPLEQVVASLPFPADIREAIVARTGDMGRALDSVVAHEVGDFARAEELSPGSNALYLESLAWAAQAAHGLLGGHAPAAAAA
jgi:c-di-GMP phosphodiesterase